MTHELLHNMGMLHTHTRLDRGEHVHVNYLNVLPDKWIDYSWNPLQFPLDTEYDCDSIMHYRDTSFNIGNSITLEVSCLLLIPSQPSDAGSRPVQMPSSQPLKSTDQC